MSKGLFDPLLDSIFDEEWLGRRGEKLTERELKLVLRTAKKGDNAGNQFYGCSAFPKCRYIKNT